MIFHRLRILQSQKITSHLDNTTTHMPENETQDVLKTHQRRFKVAFLKRRLTFRSWTFYCLGKDIIMILFVTYEFIFEWQLILMTNYGSMFYLGSYIYELVIPKSCPVFFCHFLPYFIYFSLKLGIPLANKHRTNSKRECSDIHVCKPFFHLFLLLILPTLDQIWSN